MQKLLDEIKLEWGADLPRLSQMMAAMQAHRHQTKKAAQGVSRTSTLLAASLINSTLESVLRGAGLVWDEFRDDTGAGDFTPPDTDDESRADPSLLASVKNA
ncbi:MAG: hypothetical protein O7G86_12225, partial [Gammaproteobacteria bacterium]|nr:hypothetical protein [Gammaproteobacteria bacterium]